MSSPRPRPERAKRPRFYYQFASSSFGEHTKKYAPGKGPIAALILSPTRELTNQIALEAKALTTFQPLNIVSLIGGTNINSDVRRLGGNVDIIVATPGRLHDHLKQNSMGMVQRMEQGLHFCLNEADRLLVRARNLEQVLLPDIIIAFIILSLLLNIPLLLSIFLIGYGISPRAQSHH